MSDVLKAAQEKVEARARAKRDQFFLANDVLGYDFQPDTHAELFAAFPRFDGSKPWGSGEDAENEIRDILILWSRGHYKTTAVVVVVIQAILNFPDIRILLMQGSLNVTKTLLRQIYSHFVGEAAGSRLTELFPEHCGTKEELEATKSYFTTKARTQRQLAQATVTCASPKSLKTGQHYDMGFFDDLVNEKNFRTPKLVIQLKEDFTLAQSLINPGGIRVVSGTRYAFGDLYEEIQRWQANSGKWIISITDCWTDQTSHLPDTEKIPRFPKFVMKNGQRGGFTRDDLLQMQRDDPATFACQYLNKPVHTSQQAFSEELLRGAVIPSTDTPPLSQAILVVDLASGEAVTADDSVITCGKIDITGVGYLCDMRGDQWPTYEFALHVIDMTLRHRPLKVLFENTASAKYFADYLRMVARQKNVFIPLDFIKVDNRADAKNMRVVGLAGVVKRGRFKFIAGLPKFDRLIEQAIQFPKGKYGHDDYIDTAALLHQELNKEMLSLPVRPVIRHPILAMIQDRENTLANTFTAPTQLEVDTQDCTGLE